MVVTPSAGLLEKAAPVERFNKKLKKFISEMSAMLDATVDPVGVGLAAPQVGVAKHIFLARPQENGPIYVFINPQIVETSSEEEIPHFTNSPKIEAMKIKASAKGGSSSGRKKSRGKLLEGCLSIPNIWGNVSRKKTIKLSWQDINGKRRTRTFTGFPAIIIQHELDHLNGILFTKHVLEQKEQLYRSYKNEKGEDEFEEIEV